VRPAPLDRKLLRDLWRLRWQGMAIALLVACGVAMAVMSFSAQRALASAQADFYADSRFADAFVVARRIPASRVRDLARLDGVTAVDARIVESGLMDVPGLARPATVRLVSLPQDEARALNRITLTAGRMPDPARTDEVVALKPFLDASGVALGERLSAVINGRAFDFTVVGAALSPEYVYVPAPESFMPDDAHQAVLWAPHHAVERATGMTGAVNAVALRLASGASVPQVLQALDRQLAPYGGRAAHARADQPSHRFLDAELKELSTSATILPPVFLLVAAALVHLTIGRLVEAEREQIGLLKAFGYRNTEAATPYLRLAGLIGLAGAVAGGLAGALLASAVVEQYREYFRFPVLEPRFHVAAFATAAAVAVAATLAGSLSAVRRAAALSPAVAMQPLRPTAYRMGLLDRWARGGAVNQATRMIVRNLERFPMRAALATLGLAASLSLLVGTQFLFDSIEAVVDQAYFRSQRWSESVGFAEPRSASAVADLRRMPGVYAAEPVRIVAARIKAGGRQELARLVGLESGAAFQRPLDAHDRPVPFRSDGLVVSEALAGRLGLRPGDLVHVETVEGRPAAADLRVVALATDYSGFAAYLPRRALNRLLGEGDLASGAQLLVATDARPAFYGAIEAAPQVIGASSRDDTVAGWRLAMAEAFRVMITFYVGFAAAIAFGVAYNTSRIALSERSRDLATLEVLGFGPGDCAYILVGELAILTLLAAPLGLLGGQALAHGLVAAYSREELRLPAVIGARSYGISLLAYLTAVTLAAVLVARRIWGFDLVAVLKTRE
jgi:putative ABC transport system permease protein